MPLDRFVLIIVVVMAAAGATIWVGSVLLAMTALPSIASIGLVLPTLLVAYVAWRVLADRLNSAEDDHYDRIEK
ncbi:MAG: hypothetical protein JKX69_12335 [Rhodobacteraceae bacterium]|nr:hypothetical protein [Paracoccaceae bacterium]